VAVVQELEVPETLLADEPGSKPRVLFKTYGILTRNVGCGATNEYRVLRFAQNDRNYGASFRLTILVMPRWYTCVLDFPQEKGWDYLD